MARSKGYLLPTNIDPVETRCLVVLVPDDDAYMLAVRGQLADLGSWWIWERDPDRRGKDAAARWREAFEETLELYDLMGGDMCPLQIEVTCNCGSGAPAQQCCNIELNIAIDTQIHLTPGQLADYQQITPVTDGPGVVPPGFADRAEWDAYKCRAANLIADDMQRTLAIIGPILGVLAPLATWAYRRAVIAGLATWLRGTAALALAIPGALAILAAAVIALIALGGVAATALQLGRQFLTDSAIVRAIFEANDPKSASLAVRDVLVAAVNTGLPSDVLGRQRILDTVAYLSEVWINEDVTKIAFARALVVEEAPQPLDAVDCSGFSQPGPPASLAVGLRHWWELQETGTTYLDSVRVDPVDLTKLNTVTPVAGLVGNGAQFTQAGFLRQTANVQLVPAGSSITMGGWIRPEGSQSSTTSYWLSWGDNANYPQRWVFALALINGIPRWTWKHAGAFQNIIGPNVLTSGFWHFVIGDYNATTKDLRLWVSDMITPAAQTNIGANTASTELWPFSIGAMTNAGSQIYGFKGTVDQCFVYDRVITQQERFDLRNGGLGVGYGDL